MTRQSVNLDLGTVYTNNTNRNIAVTLGGNYDMAVVLSNYAIRNIEITSEWHCLGLSRAEIIIHSCGNVETVPLSQIKSDSKSANDLTIDELMKIVYQKLDQRSIS